MIMYNQKNNILNIINTKENAYQYATRMIKKLTIHTLAEKLPIYVTLIVKIDCFYLPSSRLKLSHLYNTFIK